MTEMEARVHTGRIVQQVNGRWITSRPIVQPEISEGVLHLVVDRHRDAVTLRVPLDADRETLAHVVRAQLEAA